MAYDRNAGSSFEAGCKGPLLTDGATHYIVWRDDDAWALVAYETDTSDHYTMTEAEAREVLGKRFSKI